MYVVNKNNMNLAGTVFARGDEISDELFNLSNRARTSRLDLFWRNGKASTRPPDWQRVTRGLSGETVRGAAPGVGGFATRGGDNVVIRMAASAPGRVLQSALRSRIGKGLSEGLDQKAKRTKFMLEALEVWTAPRLQVLKATRPGGFLPGTARGRMGDQDPGAV